MKLILLFLFLNTAFTQEISGIESDQSDQSDERVVALALKAMRSLGSALSSLGKMDTSCHSISDCKLVTFPYCGELATSFKNRYLDEINALVKRQESIFLKTPMMPIPMCQYPPMLGCVANTCCLLYENCKL